MPRSRLRAKRPGPRRTIRAPGSAWPRRPAAAAGRKIARLPWHRRSCRAQRRPPAARARGASTRRWRVGSSPAALLRRGDDEEAALFDADVLEAERFQRADDALARLEGMMLAAIR